MFNLQFILDIIEAAKADKNYDEVNAVEIANLYGRDLQEVKDDIIVKRAHLEEVKKSKESLKVLKGELDKLG
tara:strand:+ start:7806 stop:8021 length:216 start_codon:yes stop_codon:yes gene_type:complete